ncbi:hypothetical protein VIBNIAM115_520012 [Vibrio nigripulchritudo AM115]|nr:hypothetical protein VIBNIAM115_520012 [Vibrio nigripulchritudo AM115]
MDNGLLQTITLQRLKTTVQTNSDIARANLNHQIVSKTINLAESYPALEQKLNISHISSRPTHHKMPHNFNINVTFITTANVGSANVHKCNRTMSGFIKNRGTSTFFVTRKKRFFCFFISIQKHFIFLCQKLASRKN